MQVFESPKLLSGKFCLYTSDDRTYPVLVLFLLLNRLRLIEKSAPLTQTGLVRDNTSPHLTDSTHTKIWYRYVGSFRSSAVHPRASSLFVCRPEALELLCGVCGLGKCAAELGHLFKSVPDTSSWQSHPERQSFWPFEIEKAWVTSAIKREAPAHASSAFIKHGVWTLQMKPTQSASTQ